MKGIVVDIRVTTDTLRTPSGLTLDEHRRASLEVLIPEEHLSDALRELADGSWVELRLVKRPT